MRGAAPGFARSSCARVGVLVLLVLLGLAGCMGAADELEVDIVASGLDAPSSLAFAPDGRLFVLERGRPTPPGERSRPRLKRLDLASGEIVEIGGLPTADTVPAYHETFNGGALGLELDREFATNRRLFLCYHYLERPGDLRTSLNRLSSFTLAGRRLESETILVDRVPGGGQHNGCRVLHGPDGRLYYATGAGADDSAAQDPGSLAGKILRLEVDGSVPDDNPFDGSLVWSLGHRNPQGLAFRPGDGSLWATEHGPNADDELNRIEKGMNYGWPHCRGAVGFGESFPPDPRSGESEDGPGPVCEGAGLDRTTYRPAIRAYHPTHTIGISDLAFLTGDAFPQWRGDLFFVALKAGTLTRVVLEGSSVLRDELVIDGGEPENYGRLRDVAVGPDGFLYVVSNTTNPRVEGARPPNPLGGLLLRIRPAVPARPKLR